jgi:nucleoside-diphosphate-sugar epimerase
MLSDEKILLTGPSGMVGRALASGLVGDNEVWGVARFGTPANRAFLDDLGVVTRATDVARDDLTELPDDFTYVIHLAFARGGADDFDPVLASTAEGTSRILAHCRSAKAALVMSSHAIYALNDDPWYAQRETDALGNALSPWAPTSPAAKLTMEAVARGAAVTLELPVVIARLNTVFGPFGGLPNMHQAMIAQGNPVPAPSDPNPHSPIHTDDMVAQLEALLDAASAPATIVNWSGDAPVTVQEWCAYAAELAGTTAEIAVNETPRVAKGAVADASKRRAITGPCRVDWKQGFDREFGANDAPEGRP